MPQHASESILVSCFSIGWVGDCATGHLSRPPSAAPDTLAAILEPPGGGFLAFCLDTVLVFELCVWTRTPHTPARPQGDNRYRAPARGVLERERALLHHGCVCCPLSLCLWRSRSSLTLPLLVGAFTPTPRRPPTCYFTPSPVQRLLRTRPRAVKMPGGRRQTPQTRSSAKGGGCRAA